MSPKSCRARALSRPAERTAGRYFRAGTGAGPYSAIERSGGRTNATLRPILD